MSFISDIIYHAASEPLIGPKHATNNKVDFSQLSFVEGTLLKNECAVDHTVV